MTSATVQEGNNHILGILYLSLDRLFGASIFIQIQEIGECHARTEQDFLKNQVWARI